ncbi:NAD(P)H-dependent oxidoreductase [uncultured Bacteroides sp.]|uniref:NAD(P)H-dependent oxidoreductase n=1 Tax=uncultured Bacteroides sp. TaxID=162156 RepID=UPI002AAB42B1|nr:NAD(P)H-dependent oxidoreductase [uncultured Bacteroides sp.]
MSLLNDFEWRYATKKFDPTKKVEQSLVDNIIEAARLAPTSNGLQPFKVITITNQELKDKILPIAFGQSIVSECSHLLVFVGWNKYTEERIDHIYTITTQERNQPADRYKNYTDRVKELYLNQTEAENFEHIARQAYIGMGFSMAEAAVLKVDSTPMEGFDAPQLDALLDLESQGLKSVLMLPIGYRDESNDWLLNLAKVRHPKDEFASEIK